MDVDDEISNLVDLHMGMFDGGWKWQDLQGLLWLDHHKKANPNNNIEIKKKMSRILHEYNESITDEEKLLAQKAKGNWFKGDNVTDQFVKHFEKFLGNNGETDQIDSSNDLFNNKLSKNEADFMVRDISKEAIFGIGDSKAPGCSAKDIKKKKILEVMSFDVGKLPMKYIGAPLITKNIGISKYNQLVERVKQKVNDWKNKALSYAGRLQLIAFVLASMHIYWASVSLIPKTTVKEIEKALKGFLWCQGDMKRGAAKVAWKNVIVKKESLWVKWVNVVKLKGISIWEVDIDDTNSGTWKAMLNLISKIKDSVWKKIGDGENTNSNVVDMIVNDEWIWPNKWKIQFSCLNHIKTPILKEGEANCTMWNERNGKSGKFSIRSIWENFKEVKTDVSWHKVVCGGCRNIINSVMDRMAIATLIYHIWNERNKTIFSQEQRNFQCLLNGIVKSMKLQLLSLKVMKSMVVKKICLSDWPWEGLISYYGSTRTFAQKDVP
ncbi:hypothetical protein Tco_0231886 [Tanacetum coccineum]